MEQGKLFCFEGIDASGKTSLIERLKVELKAEGYNVITTREPGGTFLSEHIRNLILDTRFTIDPMTEIFLFLSNRIDHVNNLLKPELSKGTIVLIDRFKMSTYAFQGADKNIDRETIDKLHSLAIGDFNPDVTFLLDISAEESSRRKSLMQQDLDRIEQKGTDYLRNVRESYLEASKHLDNVFIIDGERTKDEVFTHVFSEIKTILEAK